MHDSVLRFVRHVREQHEEHFRDPAWVLEVGSYDINGSVRPIFACKNYIGVDLLWGPGVDFRGYVHLWPHQHVFDTVISTETLEHDRYWPDTLMAMFRLTKPGGLIVVTCATDPRPEHGTTLHKPQDSPATNDYYRNISRAEFASLYHLPLFSTYTLKVDATAGDLYFYGTVRKP